MVPRICAEKITSMYQYDPGTLNVLSKVSPINILPEFPPDGSGP